MLNRYTNRYISISYRCMQRFLKRHLRQMNLDVGQFPFLLRLYIEPGSTQDQLAAQLGMDKGTVARGIAQLEQRGLARRQSDDHDRRVNHVYPTDQAHMLEKQLFAIVDELHDVMYDGLSREETEQFFSLLLRVADNIQKALGPNPKL
ncbi:MAG: MarR family winged helix-turn-helix transcriptional regulator [Oscillospiraceae bacterium]